jgi:hypothetical protein
MVVVLVMQMLELETAPIVTEAAAVKGQEAAAKMTHQAAGMLPVLVARK